MKRIMDFVDAHPRLILLLCFLINFGYGAWMMTRGNLVWVINFASAFYSLYVLAKYLRD